ncbi:superoxide dismutase family protein [Desulfuribacillus alkaliarsenatis]|uniref:Superoxide dismutase [Cu-Zn] n=1 Tax=Desulfuribacillus alkaliarsenatis TaxID=766136 RepID=A0A1E5G3R3_9FIRM|nr:superoxide dismutase family protein [Desulfuribacillus alkaliarsenatis]OEF97626.1 superoxide dismutase [Desulfuribacillus alkaliarsenatis]
MNYENSKTAVAYLKGGPLAPDLRGIVYLMSVPGGTEVFVEVEGLPQYQPATNDENPIGPHGFHIHEVGSCEVGDPEDPFQAAGQHWAPRGQPHGNHAGDFPVLFSNDGYARMSFFTNKFDVAEAIGKSIIIHKNPDDYRSQPAGDAGKRLACGLIQWLEPINPSCVNCQFL